uniref:Palmdelphin n=1 Tax=Anabas testudineus TaxID=64144 RepID=A0A3Q1HDD7_ANATE
QEKLKLQHLKKKALREQWLLQDSVSQNAAKSRKQQSLLIEMEILYLEREESIVSTKESLILNRLKAVEKSPEEIIKHVSCFCVLALFAMEINVTKNPLTGKSTVLSTATVPPAELNLDNGHEVYDDGRKCVYGLNSQQGSRDLSCISELSATEVEELLRSATVHQERYCYSPHSQTENTALYHSPTSSDRVPSPLFKDDTPYTILNPLDTTEPITAIFMGFQAAQDDSGQSQEFVGSLKAELVIIEDDEQNGEDSNVKKKSHAQPGVSSYSTGRAASEKLECVEGFGDRRTENQMEPGIRKVKKPKPCCTVC